MEYFFSGLFIVFALFILAAMLYEKYHIFKKLFHDILGFHVPNGFYTKIEYKYDMYDPASKYQIEITSKCKFCQAIIQKHRDGWWYVI